MPQPKLLISDNWLTNPAEILEKVRSYTYTPKADLVFPVSSEGDVNNDWFMLRRFEKLLGHKIVNWRDNETEVPNGSYVKVPYQVRDLYLGKPSSNPLCLVGIILLNQLTLSLRVSEDNERKGRI